MSNSGDSAMEGVDAAHDAPRVHPDPAVNARLQSFPESGRRLVETWLNESDIGVEYRDCCLLLARNYNTTRLQDRPVTKVGMNMVKATLCPSGGDARKYFSSVGMEPEVLRALFGDPNEYTVEMCSDESLLDLLRQDNQVDLLIGTWLLTKITDDDDAALSVSSKQSDKEVAKQLEEAFGRDYRGPGAQWLGEGLRRYMEMYKEEVHFGKIISVLQSSGTGKSRAVAEQARLHWGVSVCFRELGSGTGRVPHDEYPFGDKPVCEFLHTPPIQPNSGLAPLKGEEIAAAFIGALFFVLHDTIEDARHKVAQDPKRKIKEAFDCSWGFPDINDFDNSPRAETFREVRDKATWLLQSKSQEILRARQFMPSPTTPLKKTSPQVPQRTDSTQTAAHSSGVVFDQMDVEDSSGPTNLASAASATNPVAGGSKTKKSVGIAAWVAKLYNILVAEAADVLEGDQHALNLPYFAFIFDECSLLNFRLISGNVPVLGWHKGTPFDHITLLALQRIIKACDSFDFWFFMLDTTSGLHDMYPDAGKETARSWRLRSDYKPLPPWPYLPFDVMVPPPKDLPETPLEALCLSRLKVYGRPLWSTYRPDDLMITAATKLLCGNPERFLGKQYSRMDRSSQERTKLQVLALHSTRFLLNLRAEGAANIMAIASVKSHMRVLTHYNAATLMVTSEVPSEPILAIAAGKLLLDNREKYREAMRILVEELLQSSKIISQGENGETLGRIVLIVNRDATVRYNGGQVCVAYIGNDTQTITDHKTSQGNNNLHFAVRPFTLGSYLQHLVHADMIISENLGAFQSGMGWAEKVHMNFTHFVQLDNFVESYLSFEFVVMCWRRGWALHCVHDQAIIGMLLIGYCGDLSRPFDPSMFVFVVLQIKNQIDAADSKLINSITCPFLKNGLTHRKPAYMVILMDMGTSTHFWGSQKDPTGKAQVRVTKGKATKGKAWSSFEADNEYDAVRFNIRGLAPYRSLAEWAPHILQLQRSEDVELTNFSLWNDALTSTMRVTKDVLTLSLQDMEDMHEQRSDWNREEGDAMME